MWWEIRKIGSRKEQIVGLVFMGKVPVVEYVLSMSLGKWLPPTNSDAFEGDALLKGEQQ